MRDLIDTTMYIINSSTPELPWKSSYVHAVDEESGWGERYFFTYFSEFGDGRENSIIAEVILFSIIFFVSVAANILIIVCIVRFPDMKNVTNCFILNLAIGDLIFALTIPAVAYTRAQPSWKLGEGACRVVPYVQFVSGIVVLWTLALISVDRYRCVVVSPCRNKLSLQQASLCCAFVWFITAAFFTPIPIWFRVLTLDDSRKVCTLIFPKMTTIQLSICFIIPLVLLACIIPISLLCFFYQRVCSKIISTRDTWASSCVMEIKGCNRQGRRQSELSMSDFFVPWPRRFSSHAVTFPNGRHGSLSQQEELRRNKHVKVVRVVLLNVMVVFFMWVPITVVIVLIFVDGNRSLDDRNFFLRSHHFVICLLIAFLNTLVNPVLYGFLSENFRAALLRIWCCGKSKDNANILTLSSARNTNNNNNPGTRSARKPRSVSSVTET